MSYRLAARHAVGILYLRGDEPDIDPILRQKCRFALSIRRQDRGISFVGLWRWRLRQLGAFAQRKPMWVTDWASSEYAAKVIETIETWRPDVVQIEFHIMGQYLRALRDFAGPTILTIHEPGTQAMRDRSQLYRGLRQAIYRQDSLAWEAYERHLLGSVSAAVVFTDRDRQTLLPMAGVTPVHTIRPGTLSGKIGSQRDTSGSSLLFVGSFAHPPNIDAATRLVKHIFPKVRALIPTACLYIVGAHPPRSLFRAAGPGVTITGEVPDVSSYMEQTAVVLAPLRFGGGIRVKMMEALSFGRAIVASRVAAEGLDVSDGEHFLLAETDDEFVNAIIDLLNKPRKRAELAMNARAWADNSLQWPTTIRAYEAIYEALLPATIPREPNSNEPLTCIGHA